MPPSSQPPTSEQPEAQATSSVRDREIHAEQHVVDLAYGELERQLESARRSLAATGA